MTKWQKCKLGDVATVHGGKRLPKGKMLTSLPTNHPYIRITDFNGHKILLDGIQYVDNEIQKSIARYTVDAGDLVISIVGTLGLCAIIPKELNKANLTENCAKIHIKEDNVEKLFLYYQLINSETQDTIAGFDVGSTQPKLPLYNVRNIELLLPPLPEQRAIAGVLSSLDDKIDLLHRQNKTLEGMAEALWRKMFVEEADPGWPIKNIEEIANRIQYGFTQSATADTVGPKFLRITDIQGGIVNWETVPYCFATEQEFVKYKLNTGDIVIARTGASTGENLFIQPPPRAVFASYLIRIQFNNIALSRYISIHLRSPEYFSYIEGILSGSAQPNANAKQLTSFEIQLPPFDLLDKFYSSIQVFDEKYKINNHQICTLSNLKDTTLPRLISSEVRVKT